MGRGGGGEVLEAGAGPEPAQTPVSGPTAPEAHARSRCPPGM